MSASKNSSLNQTHPVFGVGNSWESKTVETAWIASSWLGDSTNGFNVTLIDTPGIGDSEGRDCVHAVDIGEQVRRLSPIDAFVLVIKGDQNRFTKALQEQLSFYEELFGHEFWNRVIIEISFWRSRQSDKEDRLDGGKDEAKVTHDLNIQLKEFFGLVSDIPVVFVDPKYGARRRQKPEELQTFKDETQKLWNFVSSNNSYTCKGHCENPGFLEGKPTLMSEPEVNARIDDKVVLKFNVWFSGCDRTDVRSYDIFKDGVKIWTVIDEQGEKRTRFKPIQKINNANTPLNMDIFDHCSQTLGNRGECDIKLSKFKVVDVVLAKVAEDAFGRYYVNNSAGRSQEVFIQKVVDGSYSSWSEWGPWDEVTPDVTCTFSS